VAEVVPDSGAHEDEPRDAGFCEGDVVFHSGNFDGGQRAERRRCPLPRFLRSTIDSVLLLV
jgi:hypothetical protein